MRPRRPAISAMGSISAKIGCRIRAMSRLDKALMLHVGDRCYDARDVIHAADFRGELEPHVSQLRRAIAATTSASARGLESGNEDLQKLSDETLHDAEIAEVDAAVERLEEMTRLELARYALD